MRQCATFILVGVGTALLVASCHNSGAAVSAPDRIPDVVVLAFNIELNRHVYEDSAWGDPPQLAIWLESETSQDLRTAAVTHRTGAGDWEGKVECSVALPCWVAFYNRQTGTTAPPTWDHPAPDAVTCATPRVELDATLQVPRGSRWRYFVEVNVSGDYSTAFPSLTEAGLSDRYGNGQPSIVYRGTIEATAGRTSQPDLWGRTDQHVPMSKPIPDLQPITTAKDLLRSITVSCTSGAGRQRTGE
ncbi:MAG: hypothetical protein JSW27_23880 [Phycisphaerales bacterium]|nr:MAG: hypothetical protein JSW27_23880 [Phycisphaerales bacterium]